MNGYYFSERHFESAAAAERRAARRRGQAGVKAVKVCYGTGKTVDIKKFI